MADNVQMEELNKDESSRLLDETETPKEEHYEQDENIDHYKSEPAVEMCEPTTPPEVAEEEFIFAKKNDNEVSKQKDLKDSDHSVSLKDRQDFEKEMDEVLEAGDLDDINEWITPYKLTKCATNCLEKSLEVSYKLKRLANSKGPDADDFHALATSVEDFAIQLLEPLKSDDMKRAIFEGEDFDRVSDKAVKYQQKKFVSHPVVYNLLMKRRWTGPFSHLRYGNREKYWLKWVFLNLWTFLDVFLFPVVYGLLWFMHFLIGFAAKRKDLRIVFIFNASWKYADIQLRMMQSISKEIMSQFKADKIQYATITRSRNGPIVNEFSSSEDATTKISDTTDVEYPTRDGRVFLTYLKTAQRLFRKTREALYCHKVVVIMTDDKFGVPSSRLLRAVRSLQHQQIKVVSVGLGVHPEIKELETIATNDEHVVLLFNNESVADETKKPPNRILKCIRGKDIFDRYVQYFTTPYFICLRDTLSYLTLLGLHFVMCLQPSEIPFTAIEWIILVFFLGRFMIEINQVVTNKNTDLTERKDVAQQEDAPKKEKQDENESPSSPKLEDEEEQSEMNRKISSRWNELWRVVSGYFDDWWNILDVVTLVVFLVLFGLRVFSWIENASVSKNRLLAVAGYLYGLNAMFLSLRVFGHILESIKSTGSIQIALFQIIGAVIAIFGQFFAATLAFSLAITKIYIAEVSYNSGTNGTFIGLCDSQNGLDCWWSATRHLAWSLLGIADLGPLESSDSTSDTLVKLLYGLFLIMGVVMLMNMMIALLSNTYQNVEDNSFYEWSYKKATTIRTYTKYHPVPVPFNVISLSFKLLRHIYRKINCARCKRSHQNDLLEKSIEKLKTDGKKSLFDCLVTDLQVLYFPAFGYSFPLADDNKINRVLKETEGSHQLMAHIVQRVFRYDQKETQQLQPHGHPEWDTKGIEVFGQRLVHNTCKCTHCVENGEIKNHGAKYLNPLSKEYPEFEVLIQESGERRFIVIGVVTRNYEVHKFPGLEGNTAGYHIDDGKIFDGDNSVLGKDGDNAMAFRGDLIGCRILYEKQTETKLPVSFSRNGRVIGEANLTCHRGFSSGDFYPYVGTGCKGISLLFRICPNISLSRVDTEPVIRMLGTISMKLQTIDETQAIKLQTIGEGHVKKLEMIVEMQDQKFEMISEKQAELERKIDLLLSKGVMSFV